MKKWMTFLCALFCLCGLTGCDPVLPEEGIQAVYAPSPLMEGETAEIQITYPDTANTAVVAWGEPTVTLLAGEEVVEVSGLSVKGLEPGEAKVRVEVQADCSFLGFIIDRPVFSTELTIEVVVGE